MGISTSWLVDGRLLDLRMVIAWLLNFPCMDADDGFPVEVASPSNRVTRDSIRTAWMVGIPCLRTRNMIWDPAGRTRWTRARNRIEVPFQ